MIDLIPLEIRESRSKLILFRSRFAKVARGGLIFARDSQISLDAVSFSLEIRKYRST
jgi:hypothetical protein